LGEQYPTTSCFTPLIPDVYFDNYLAKFNNNLFYGIASEVRYRIYSLINNINPGEEIVLKNRVLMAIIPFIFLILMIGPFEIIFSSNGIDVDDGSLLDWDSAAVLLGDIEGDSPVSMTDLALVSFDYDETWLYVRWDLYDNMSYKSGVLYDMGINLTATGSDWDIFVSAEIDLNDSLPEVVNISIRDTGDNHIWNASDDGNMTEDGTLYLDPTPGLPPGNLSVEARFPLASLGITSGIIFSQFRSHSSPSVNSAVKDQVPDIGYIILIIDNYPPEINNLMDTPDPQENGGTVNISVDVTDDIGIQTVWVIITHPNGSFTNISMDKGQVDNWYLDKIYDDPGIYYYTIWANDTKNWNRSGPENFTIIDTDGPFFEGLLDTPDPQENSAPLVILVNVTDDVGVGEVWINITYPDLTWFNTSMTQGPGNDWTFTSSFNDLGIFSYYIWANDTSDNWNSTGPGTFEIIDTDGPFFDNLIDTPDPQENGGSVAISVDVTDDINVGLVWINITYPDSSWLNTTMTQGIGDEWSYTAFYDDLGTYSYMIWANDTNGNWNNEGPNTFTIHDSDGPFFDNLVDAPDPQENSGNVNISIDVTDDFAVDSVYVNITYPGGTSVNVSMDVGSNENWFINTTLDDIGDYSYTIYANDVNNNWNSTSSGTITIQDTDGPSIDNLTHTPDPAENGDNVNVTVDVIDDVDVGEVWINITFPDGTWTNTTMKPGHNTEWFIDKTFDDPGDYTYTIWARDTSYNWVEGGSGIIRIRDTDGPEFSDLVDSPDPQDIGKNVNISVEVTDDIGVDSVWIIITFPNGTMINATMEEGPDNQYYYNGTFDSDGDYTYTVWARDESGNTNATEPSNFIISPEPPEEGLTLFEMITLFFFWPLLLIIFTVALVQRYGSNNRFRKEIKPVLISQRDHYLAHPEEVPLVFDKFLDIAALAVGVGIPPEELIMAAFELEGYPIFKMEVIAE
jgi:hypothetical protein